MHAGRHAGRHARQARTQARRHARTMAGLCKQSCRRLSFNRCLNRSGWVRYGSGDTATPGTSCRCWKFSLAASTSSR